MSTVEEIKSAITKLTLTQRAELARWMHEWNDDEWDRQMRRDAAGGKLGKLLAEVDAEVKGGRLRRLP